MKNMIYKVIDDKGRILIPYDLRKVLKLTLNDLVRISYYDDFLLIQKVEADAENLVLKLFEKILRNGDMYEEIESLFNSANSVYEEDDEDDFFTVKPLETGDDMCLSPIEIHQKLPNFKRMNRADLIDVVVYLDDLIEEMEQN